MDAVFRNLDGDYWRRKSNQPSSAEHRGLQFQRSPRTASRHLAHASNICIRRSDFAIRHSAVNPLFSATRVAENYSLEFPRDLLDSLLAQETAFSPRPFEGALLFDN